VWNDLPADVVDFRSLQSFKKTISTVDFSKYLSDTYTVSQKNDNDVLRYNFNAHQPILIIFGRYTAE